MIDCVLHVGFGKTGTSALQAHLCRHPELGTPRGHRYVVVDGEGGVLDGDRLRARAEASPHPYLASTPGLWERGDLDAVGAGLAAVRPRGVPVLSQEDWSRTGRKCLDARALQRLGVRAQVVAYVRPQVEWFNSGWWQWWTWQDQFDTPADVIATWGPAFLRWERQLDRWARNPNVSRLTVRLYRGDTIPDFLRLLGAVVDAPAADAPAADAPVNASLAPAADAPAADAPVNASLAPLHIRILKSVPGLRGPHTPQVDWLLQKHLPSAERTPWALGPEVMQAIVDGCRRDNERLLKLLSPEGADRMRRDPRWWSIEPYRGRAVTTADDLRATPHELAHAVGVLVRALAARD